MTQEPETIKAEIVDPIEPEAAAILSDLLKQSEEQLIALLKSNGKRTQTLKKITADIASYPYGEKGRALFSADKSNDINEYLDVVNVYSAASPEVKTQAEELTNGGIKRMASIIQQAYPDALAITRAMDAGKFKTLEGKRWPRDGYNLSDLSAFTSVFPVPEVKKSELESFTIAKDRANIQGMKLYKDAETSAHVIGIPNEGGEAVVIPYGALMGVWAAFTFLTRLDLKGYGLEIVEAIQKSRRERRDPINNESLIITTPKPENAMFDPTHPNYIRTTHYNGTPVNIETTPSGDYVQLSLALDLPNLSFDEMTQAERAEAQLTEEQRFWLTALQSIIKDNPDKTRVYGTEILQRWGYKNPWQKNSKSDLQEALAAIERMTQIRIFLDVTGEQETYRAQGKVLQSIQARPIVHGIITVEKYETKDGEIVGDWFIDLTPRKGKDSIDALPTLAYAIAKDQLITAPSEVFVFDGIKTLKQDKLIMMHIYKRIKAKGMSNTILFSTMFEALGITLSPSAKSRMHQKLERLLNYWKDTGVIGQWTFRTQGRKVTGVTITPPKKRLK